MGRRVAPLVTGLVTGLVAGLVLLAAGCGGGSAGPGGSGGGSSSPSPSPSSTSSSPLEAPEPEPTPTVGPASGVKLAVNGFRVNAPRKWLINNDTVFGDTAVGPVDDGRSGSVLLAVVAHDQGSVDAAMRYSFQPGTRSAATFERRNRPTPTLGGLTAFYYTYSYADNKNTIMHVTGTWDSGYYVHLTISLPTALSPERQQEYVDSIIATYRSPRTG